MSATIPTQLENNSTRLAIQAIQDEATKPLHVEIERLRHDATRYQQCMADLAGEIGRLNALLQRCADTIDCLRDYVVEGGSIRMVGARQSIDEADELLAAMAGGDHG